MVRVNFRVTAKLTTAIDGLWRTV